MFVPVSLHKKGMQVLGITQESGIGSHLQAGARAQVIATELTRALSTNRGRIMARTIQYVLRGNIEDFSNYAGIRPYGIMEAIKIALGDAPENKIVLDPVSGYSPEFYWLAQALNKTQFIEMDTQKVIDHKQAVFDKFGMPDNLRLEPINLKEQNLHQVQTSPVDIIVSLGTYVSHVDYRHMLKYLAYLLNADGYIVTSFPYSKGIDHFVDNSFIFSNMVGSPTGVVDSEDMLANIFEGTDFQLTKVIKLSELAQKLDKPMPADIEIIAIAQRKPDNKI